MSNFYQDMDLKYPEMAILLEDAVMEMDKKTKEWKRKKAKVTIPVLMPDMYSDSVIEKDIWQDNAKVRGSNYVELTIPKYLYPSPKYIKDVPVKYEDDTKDDDKVVYKYETKVVIPKGTKLIVVFIGGSFGIDKIKVIGLFDDEVGD